MSKLRLMVVDDERDNLDLLYRTFRRDFQVHRADSPLDAIALLDTEGEMAVIITDQSMPEMTGLELLSKARVRFPHTIGILLTGYSEDALEASQDMMNKANVFKCISKPFDTQDLKALVQTAAEIYQTNKQSA
ncbi:response regulator [Oscillatoria acuminata]|uniref:Response regulator with CheY-like receiver, AAA-type ATPase, and DNA-binding domains n=1 Tax=Oscillatoria acuminata PCC 6304 TaxID=56110 RepID=K9TFD7_9CYAN|nr:response regulator [Oscillatoria acuminata]AFY80831.1 response regulator with CheY-like receiver, AAA-type ATPase, and DNA-binding domains [Oscillatoria acuminata PCC 6304]